MCRVLGVSRSGYYRWSEAGPSARTVENRRITGQIRAVHGQSRQTYGSPRIAAELRAQGVEVSRPRVARLMRLAGIRSVARKKFVATTDSGHAFPVAPNLLDRDFRAGLPGRAWVSDITYIRTAEGWTYLTVVIDLATRRVVGWALSRGLSAAETSVAAWKMAVRHRPPGPGLVFHSDRGVQYACTAFTRLLGPAGAVQSMSRKANCWDNAVAESFFRTLKVEWVYRNLFATRAQAENAVFDYIETWYNTRRRHSTLGYLPPAEYELNLSINKTAA